MFNEVEASIQGHFIPVQPNMCAVYKSTVTVPGSFKLKPVVAPSPFTSVTAISTQSDGAAESIKRRETSTFIRVKMNRRRVSSAGVIFLRSAERVRA